MADAAQAGAQTQIHRSTAALLRLHEGYGQRLQSASDDLLDHYASMLKASRLTDDPAGDIRSEQTQSAKDDFEIAVRSERIVQCAESLQKLISELKLAALVSADYPEIIQEVQSMTEIYIAKQAVLQRSMTHLARDVDALLASAEAHYFASQARATCQATI